MALENTSKPERTILKLSNYNLEIIKFNGLKTNMEGTIQISGEMHFHRKRTRGLSSITLSF